MALEESNKILKARKSSVTLSVYDWLEVVYFIGGDLVNMEMSCPIRLHIESICEKIKESIKK